MDEPVVVKARETLTMCAKEPLVVLCAEDSLWCVIAVSWEDGKPWPCLK